MTSLRQAPESKMERALLAYPLANDSIRIGLATYPTKQVLVFDSKGDANLPATIGKMIQIEYKLDGKMGIKFGVNHPIGKECLFLTSAYEYDNLPRELIFKKKRGHEVLYGGKQFRRETEGRNEAFYFPDVSASSIVKVFPRAITTHYIENGDNLETFKHYFDLEKKSTDDYDYAYPFFQREIANNSNILRLHRALLSGEPFPKLQPDIIKIIATGEWERDCLDDNLSCPHETYIEFITHPTVARILSAGRKIVFLLPYKSVSECEDELNKIMAESAQELRSEMTPEIFNERLKLHLMQRLEKRAAYASEPRAEYMSKKIFEADRKELKQLFGLLETAAGRAHTKLILYLLSSELIDLRLLYREQFQQEQSADKALILKSLKSIWQQAIGRAILQSDCTILECLLNYGDFAGDCGKYVPLLKDIAKQIAPVKMVATSVIKQFIEHDIYFRCENSELSQNEAKEVVGYANDIAEARVLIVGNMLLALPLELIAIIWNYMSVPPTITSRANTVLRFIPSYDLAYREATCSFFAREGRPGVTYRKVQTLIATKDPIAVRVAKELKIKLCAMDQTEQKSLPDSPTSGSSASTSSASAGTMPVVNSSSSSHWASSAPRASLPKITMQWIRSNIEH